MLMDLTFQWGRQTTSKTVATKQRGWFSTGNNHENKRGWGQEHFFTLMVQRGPLLRGAFEGHVEDQKEPDKWRGKRLQAEGTDNGK